MRTAIALTLLACLVAGPARADDAAAGHARLTTNLLEQTSEALLAAREARDAETVLAHVASNAVIAVIFPDDPECPKVTLNKEEYAGIIRDAYARTTKVDVSSQRLGRKYVIAPDGQSATVETTTQETITNEETGQTVTSTKKQVSTVMLIDGIPKAVRIEATISQRQELNQER